MIGEGLYMTSDSTSGGRGDGGAVRVRPWKGGPDIAL